MTVAPLHLHYSFGTEPALSLSKGTLAYVLFRFIIVTNPIEKINSYTRKVPNIIPSD
jgi:hypothetical protein